MFGSLETLSKCIRCSTESGNNDESIEISVHHKKLIKKSWKVISIEFSNTQTHVCGFTDIGPTDAFIEMFEKYPESRNFFVQFNGSGVEEIQSNPELFDKLKEHSERVFRVVEKVIHKLGNNFEKVRLVPIKKSFINFIDIFYNN